MSTIKPSLQTPFGATQLNHLLRNAPLTSSTEKEKEILTECYRSLWNDHKEYLRTYFFPEGLSDNDSLSTLLEKYNLLGIRKQKASGLSEEEDLSDNEENQRGKQCGHLFKRGESVYHCRNCGLDDTCVMCSRCFHATDHEGHDVKIWIGRGAGCCDCGDPEAWKVPLCCKIHSIDSSTTEIPTLPTQLLPSSSIPAPLLTFVRETIRVVIDYVLETFAASPEDVMSIGTLTSVKSECLESHRALKLNTDLKNQKYTCVLWNDEKHSFDSVISVLQEALDCTPDIAEEAANAVNTYGRHAVEESSDIQHLIQVANTINSIGLSVTITSVQKLAREEIAGVLLNWLNELVSGRYKFFSTIDGGSCIIRDIVCEVLSTDWALAPELARLSTRYRRAKMPVDVDDAFDFEEEGVIEEEMMEEEEMGTLFNDPGAGMLFTPAEELLQAGFLLDEVDMEDDEDDDESQNNEEGTRLPINFQNSTILDFIEAVSQQPQDATSGVPQEQRNTESLKRRRSSSSSESRLSKNQKLKDILDIDWSLEAWLDYMDKLEQNELQIAGDLGISTFFSEKHVSTSSRQTITTEFRRKLRLDYLLQFDLRLWKTARTSIKNLIISTFISNYQYRPVLGTRFARNYPELVDAFFFKDREPENSVSTLSVQLLTVPTVAALLVKEYKFFGMVCSILANFFLTDNVHLVLSKDYSQVQVDSSFRAIGRHRYAYTIYDLRYIMNSDQVKLEITKNPVYLRHFIDMLYQFQAMDPLQRKTDEHVAFESQTWVNAFNVTLQIAKLCRQYAACYDTSQTDISLAESSYHLCRTIYRVLKAIVDWSPVGDGVVIQGIREHKYQSITTRHAATLKVVAYDVTTEPVSFHHPFHWLLSELFENVGLLTKDLLKQNHWPSGLKSMVSHAFVHSGQGCFLDLLEYPIRTLVILSQINCGVWVRNGYGIRNQSHTYKDINVRENTLDRDIYLLQVGLSVCDSDHLLMTLISRFQLLDWFEGRPNQSHVAYDTSQNTFMVEELLNLLIVCATEHGFASGTTIEQRVRRAIIQYLGLARLSYSELLKLIPESLNEHESFEAELNKVAYFRAPDGLNDKGIYGLKSEYLDMIDPYFWHYTRNKREEAHAVLKQRWNQLHPENPLKDEEEFLLLPAQTESLQQGPFRYLTNFLHSAVFNQMIFYGLWNSAMSAQGGSEVVLDEVLYLAMLAVTDKNNGLSDPAGSQDCGNFFTNAVSDVYLIEVNKDKQAEYSLLDILLCCLDNGHVPHAHKRLRFILDKLEENVQGAAKSTILAWKEEQRRHLPTQSPAQSAHSDVSEYQRKKMEAKARQAKIMSQFAMAQTKFMEKHSDLYASEDEEEKVEEVLVQETEELGSEYEIVRKCHFPTDNCIVCQENFDGTKLHGMLGLLQKSNLQRLSPMTKDIWTDILETGCYPVHPWASAHEEGKERGSSFSGFPAGANRAGVDLSSCGHLMHAECFEIYQHSVELQNRRTNRLLGEGSTNTTKGRFLCPFCKALGNVLIPVVWKGKREVYPGVVAPANAYEGLEYGLSQLQASATKGAMAAREDTEVTPLAGCNEANLKTQYLKLMGLVQGAYSRKEPSTELSVLYDMYAYTIGNFEIAQRGAEDTRRRDLTVEHTGTFIDDISNTSQTLLKILAMTNNVLPRLGWSWQPKCLDQVMPENRRQESSCALLMDDPFRVLVHLDFASRAHPGTVEAHHILRLLYVAELVKNVIGIAQSIYHDEKVFREARLHQLTSRLEETPFENSAQIASSVCLVDHVLGVVGFQQDPYQKLTPKGWTLLLRLFTLPYLRKALLLMVAHHGFIPQNTIDDSVVDVHEFDKLLETLRLPLALDLLPLEKERVGRWCTDYCEQNKGKIPMHLPTKYRIANLPYRLDHLLDEISKRICRRCNNVPEHAAICLICGSFVCARSFCCTEMGKGECNNHLASCGGEVGIYMMIKDCFLLLIHDNGGSIMNAPYLDNHGEADVFFKRGAPQYLNSKRYEQIRHMWLTHSIPSFIRRRMEASQTSTNWEAF